MVPRLAASALALVCVLAILFLVAFRTSGADFDGDWLYEELTCEELVSAYEFEREMLDQIKVAWGGCLAYADSTADAGHGELHCALLRKEGVFVQGMVNDIADVFNAKEECK